MSPIHCAHSNYPLTLLIVIALLELIAFHEEAIFLLLILILVLLLLLRSYIRSPAPAAVHRVPARFHVPALFLVLLLFPLLLLVQLPFVCAPISALPLPLPDCVPICIFSSPLNGFCLRTRTKCRSPVRNHKTCAGAGN